MVPFHFLMSLMVFLSTVMVICSSSWVSMWVALEINTLSLMPLMKSKGASKYFLAQSLGSAFILSGAVFSQELLIVVGAVVKSGVAPLHSWFPQVMENLTWKLCLVLSTWQKIGPMVVIFSSCSGSVLSVFIIFSLTMGAMGALKQSRLRSVLAYSSITHMGWTLSGVMSSVSIGVIYFFSYCVMSLFVMMKLANSNSLSSVMKDLSLVLLLFSMSGLPPFIGLFPKMWVFFSCPFFLSAFLISSSVIMIYVYTSMMFSSLGKIKSFYAAGSIFTMLSVASMIF